ncbi:FecR domain-containing protein, partial [Sulfuritalea sp.]|uniref:FecR domain-containing protein n=1 Tax=Sulfuritalea sp. TaxID=2480090 RepID=UPI001AC7D23A
MTRPCDWPGRHLLCAALVAALFAPPLAAAETIGRVAETSGTVVRIKAAGAPELLGGGSPLATGDVIETQANSGAELRYDDGTVVRLAARSRFTVPEYRLAPQQAGEERFVSRLLAGAMRVVTGTIAKRQPRNARFVAHTATIGIRGTDFVVRLCDDDCVPAEGPTVARAGEELAGRVGGTAGDVSAIDARGRWRELPTSAALREGDQILTGATGIAVLVLRDGTRIALDPNSRLAIREFRYDEAAPRQGRITLELVDGKAQFASGQLAKQNPERFRFVVGEQSVRVHGTTVGAQRLRFPDDNPAPANPLAAPPPELPKNPTLGMNGDVVLPGGKVLEARRDGSGQMRFFEKIDRGEPICRLPDGSHLYADPAPRTDGSIEWRFELRGDQAVFVDVGNTGAPGTTRSEPFAVPVGAALVQDGRLVFTSGTPYRENEGGGAGAGLVGSGRTAEARFALQTNPDGSVTTTTPLPPIAGNVTLADGSRLVSGNPQAINALVGEYLGARDTFLTQHPPPPPPPPPPPVAQAPLGSSGDVVLPGGKVLEARRDGSGQMRFFEKIDRGEPIGRLPDGSPLYADPAPGTDGSIEWRFELRGDQAVFVDVGNSETTGATRSESVAVPVGAALVQDGRLVFTTDRPYRENEGGGAGAGLVGSGRTAEARFALQTNPDGTVTTTAPPPPVTGSITLADGSRLVSGNPQALNSLVGEFLGARDTFLTQHPPPPPPPPPPPVAQAPLGSSGDVVLPNGRVLEARRDASGQMRFFEKIDRGEPIGRLPDGSPLYANPAPGTDGSIEWRFELRGDQAVFVDVGNTETTGATRSEPFAVPVGAALVRDGRLVFTADRPYRENEGSNEHNDHATGTGRQVASRYSLQTDPDGTVTTAAPPPPVTGSITLADGSRLVSGNPQALNSLVGEFLGARQAALSGPNPGTLAGPPGTGADTGDSIGAGGSRGRSGSRVGVTDGNVSLFSRYGDELRLARGETAGASDGKPPLKGEIPLTFATLSPDRIDVDRARFFGADATAGDNGKARNGVYVSVLEGAVGLAQGGAEVVLGEGETALAPVDGGPPLKV